MVAGLALEPRKIMSDITRMDAPPLIRRPVGGSPPPPPVREDPDVVAVHQEWARIHAAETDTKGGRPSAGAGAGAGAGIRTMARSRLAAVAAGALGPAQRDDRALIGDLIRATDALARRCDELGGRLAELEALVEEVVAVVSEDLVQVRALLTPRPSDDPEVGLPESRDADGRESSGTAAGDG